MQRSSTSLAIAGGVYFVLAALFAWAFYERYWRWRGCIDEALSSCVTPDGDNLTAGGMVWSLPAAIFLLLALRNIYRWRRSR
jgi:hypothetical protein